MTNEELASAVPVCKASAPLLYDDIIRSRGMQGTSAERFRQTWTSATEREALELRTVLYSRLNECF